jgi:hypothetical protein
MHSQELPLYKSTLDLCVYVDTIVKNQEKYHKYGIGEELRQSTREMFYLVGRVTYAKEKQELLEALVVKCDETKNILVLAKAIKAFKSFKQFEHSSRLTVNVCRQAQAWLGTVRVSK